MLPIPLGWSMRYPFRSAVAIQILLRLRTFSQSGLSLFRVDEKCFLKTLGSFLTTIWSSHASQVNPLRGKCGRSVDVTEAYCNP